MEVSTTQPFQIIYSLFAHEYLGDLFESFVVQVNSLGKLTFLHQNISSKNAKEFASGLDKTDFELIKLMDSIQQDVVVPKFHKKKINPDEFFLKVYNPEKPDEMVQKAISLYIDNRMSQILPLLVNKKVFVMGNDGEPTGKPVEVCAEEASMQFHFRRDAEKTHYFPTIKHRGEKIDFQYNNSQVLCNEPAWLLVKEEKIVRFRDDIDGKKIKPFLNKKFIVIPKKVEETYFKNFVSPLVANFDVVAKGFTINDEVYEVTPVLIFKELITTEKTLSLFDDDQVAIDEGDIGKLVFEISFRYGKFLFPSNGLNASSVSLEKVDDDFVFHKVHRNISQEKKILEFLEEKGLTFKSGKLVINKASGFSWITANRTDLISRGFDVEQHSKDKRKYFVGKSTINLEIKENNDWFDIYAIAKFGDYEIPFLQLKKLIMSKKREFELPNGEIAVIPEEWIVDYSELFAFSHEGNDSLQLEKHHLSLVHELSNDASTKLTINNKLEKLRELESIEDYPLPLNFKGELRPYQKGGYNWLRFLNEYNFGGCLADDMGLGKTVQTLALLQYRKECGNINASLLIMPTSLVYNWEVEATKFAPDLRILVYTGTYRNKDILQFMDYDIVITTYGVTRIDVDLFKTYLFDYIILDESQTIKNPNSNIAQAVIELKSKFKLILTGTPIENSTMDLWSQMNFVNSGLLGGQTFFKNNFLIPIEKKNDQTKKQKLYTIIKPFLLRRKKSQVLTELPEKIEQVYYTTMTPEQEKIYEETKSYYRSMILDQIETQGMGKSQMNILQGLTKLRQLANHPVMVEPDYKDGSGKMNDVIDTLQNAIDKDHKILVFSQFVKHLSLFEKALQKEGITYAYLDGSTKDRQAEVDKFQTDESIRVFLISLKAGGLGLNLTAADYVFILDPWWNPAIESQAVDRAYRMGQKNTVHTYKFICKNTVEEKILKLQERKKRLAEDLISTEEGFMKNLSKEDIEDILA